ncbi:hypothetical protein L596_010638 [Steinernema carpocapsae]|uniref:C2H2-type domain-containing protein n=1 Tax=Steinernema carpocapsae TaxID=34508 RepID=A0A4U5PJJ3_STECR|nr:hypothetical protein L596_010638 [Steinernema carpocapsae]
MNSHQYHRLQEIREWYNEESPKYLDRYFPPESFVQVCDQKRKSKSIYEESKCVDCGKIVPVATTRRLHVARHIGLSIECVISGCSSKATTNTYSKHLRIVHSKKLKDLTKEELYEYKTARVKFTKTVNKALPEYFPYKTKIEEEE